MDEIIRQCKKIIEKLEREDLLTVYASNDNIYHDTKYLLYIACRNVIEQYDLWVILWKRTTAIIWNITLQTTKNRL